MPTSLLVRPGTFAVFDLSRPGKQPDVPPLVLAHEQAITGMDISPHVGLESLVVTGYFVVRQFFDY